MKYELAIPETAPSPNQVMRLHWAERKKLWDRWGRFIWACVLTQGRLPEKPPERARVTITRSGVRLLDPDNLTGSCKPVIDALTRNRLITDDSSEHIELEVRQVRKPTREKPCTLIEVEAI